MADRSLSEIENTEDVRPDWSFMRQLKTLDKRLGCRFNGTHFVITCETKRFGEVNIWKVVDEGGGFRQPDQRELDMLRQADIEKQSPNEKFNLITAYMEQYQEKKRNEAREEIRNRTIDDRRQLIKAFHPLLGIGKANSAFRRIDVRPKPKGEGVIIIP